MKAAILTDTTKCIGCRECVIACKKEYNLEPETPRRWNLDDGLGARNWTSIIDLPGDVFVRKQCRHCLDPACVSACPVAALRKDDNGAVFFDAPRCMGCRYCMMSCPYEIPRYDWDQTIPYIRKCVLCNERIKEGRQPACTEACPSEATIFGDRDELIAEAHKRISENPDNYIDKVWGEHEVGGTSVLYISDTDLSFLTRGLSLGDEPAPGLTKLAMNAVPFAFVGAVASMATINWIVNRRMELAKNPEPVKPAQKENDDA